MNKLAAALGGFDTAGADEWGQPQKSGVGFVRIDGSHDSTERLEAVRRFRSDPSVRVALLSITAAGGCKGRCAGACHSPVAFFITAGHPPIWMWSLQFLVLPENHHPPPLLNQLLVIT